MEETVNDNMASKDANDFIASCAVCNKSTVIKLKNLKLKLVLQYN